VNRIGLVKGIIQGCVKFASSCLKDIWVCMIPASSSFYRRRAAAYFSGRGKSIAIHTAPETVMTLQLCHLQLRFSST
jgi:hypothetical protein